MLIKKIAYNNADLFQLLSSGGKYSVIDIMQRLNISDPKGAIEDLRNFGVEIHEELITTRVGGRFKMYWIQF